MFGVTFDRFGVTNDTKNWKDVCTQYCKAGSLLDIILCILGPTCSIIRPSERPHHWYVKISISTGHNISCPCPAGDEKKGHPWPADLPITKVNPIHHPHVWWFWWLDPHSFTYIYIYYSHSFYMVHIWVCLKIVYPYTQWLMIIIPTKWL